MWTVTYTGKSGAGVTVTSLVLHNVTNVNYDWVEMVVTIFQGTTVAFIGTLTGVTTVTTTVATKSITIS